MSVYIISFANLIENEIQRDYFVWNFQEDCSKYEISQEEYIPWLTDDLAKAINHFLKMVEDVSDGFCNSIFCRFETPLVLGYVDKKICFNFDGQIFQLRYI